MGYSIAFSLASLSWRLPERTMPDSSPSKSEVEQLFHLLSRAHHQMLSALQREIDQLGISGDLHPGMRHLFCTLAEEDGMTVSDLANRLSMAKSSVTGALRRMESAGLVELRPDDRDLRLRRVRLTRVGKALKPTCVQIDAAISQRLDSEFTPREKAQVLELLDRLVGAMAPPDDA